ncbi:LPS export ABC transporter periplasmic protein LptC [bacterium]|nr:LPS export ABC transporter periplasmic protein LptC [bacterium]
MNRRLIPALLALSLLLAAPPAWSARKPVQTPEPIPTLPPAPSVPAGGPAIPPPVPGVGGWGATPTPKPSLAPLKPGAVKGAVRILSQSLSYDRKASLALLEGAVKIFQDDMTIETEKLRHDSKVKVSYIEVPFKLVQTKPDEPTTTLNGKKMTFFHNEKRVFVDGEVRLLRAGDPGAQPAGPAKKEKLKAALKREDTFIQSDKMMYWTQKKDADFTGNVLAFQKEKRAEGNHAFMDNTRKKIFMDGNVILTQIKGDWLVREGIVDTSKPDPERDKAIKEKTVATGDNLEIDQVTNDSILTGQLVKIDQKDRHATGKRAVFSDKDQTITLTQDVKIRRESGDWINAERAVFHTDSDKFEAFGGQGSQVETEFKLDEENK